MDFSKKLKFEKFRVDERASIRAVSLNRLTGSHMNLRKTDSNSSAGSAASAAPANGETASGPGTPMTGEKIKLGKQCIVQGKGDYTYIINVCCVF